MEQDIRISMLYDIYGKLLTRKQQEIFEEYYLFNLSLREIAENKSISYQAVRDSIEKSKKLLERYEEIVGMYKLRTDIENMCIDNNDIKKDDILKLLK